MARKTDARRADLRARLLSLAEEKIATDGVHALRARDLAAEAGCSVGAIYTHFSDLSKLVLEINAKTFERLGAAIEAQTRSAGSAPHDQLAAMSKAYVGFARDNRLIWRALFEVDVGDGAPEWYRTAMGALFGRITSTLEDIVPEMDDPDRELFARALFSSVHGVVALGLDQIAVGVPEDRLEDMAEVIVRRATQ